MTVLMKIHVVGVVLLCTANLHHTVSVTENTTGIMFTSTRDDSRTRSILQQSAIVPAIEKIYHNNMETEPMLNGTNEKIVIPLPSDFTVVHVDSLKHSMRRRRDTIAVSTHDKLSAPLWDHSFQLPIGPSGSFVSVLAEPNYALFSHNATLTIVRKGAVVPEPVNRDCRAPRCTRFPSKLKQEYLIGMVVGGEEGTSMSHVRVHRDAETGVLTGHAIVNGRMYCGILWFLSTPYRNMLSMRLRMNACIVEFCGAHIPSTFFLNKECA